MHLSYVMLSRIQFAFTIAFHIIFPSLNIGLALFLTIMEAAWLKTKNPIYLNLCKFWTKIFALTFGMGVVGGIVMAYELGTNFAGFINQIGGVLGSLFAYEVLSAFFLEAGFLGVMLFGWNRVGHKLHFAATFLVMLGTTISAFWIMAANSWMQTPDGYQIINGKYVVDNWYHVIFNHSTAVRFTHMVLASYASVCFFIAGISAYYLIKGTHLDMAKRCFSFVLWAALILMPIQVVMGDRAGLIDHEYQPIKTAAIEAVWDTQKAAPLVLFAWPNQDLEKNQYAISIPYGASLFNTHSLDGELTGLNTVAPQDRPYVPVVFFSFRIMVGLGLIMFFIALAATILRFRNRLYEARWFHYLCILITPIGLVATIAGWFTAETGRQPWVVYNLIRTADAASKVAAEHVWISLIGIFIVYTLIFCFYLFYLLKFIQKGPHDGLDLQEEPLFSYMGSTTTTGGGK